jgi:hypothetical protein
MLDKNMKFIIPLFVCISLFCSCSRDTRSKTELIDAIVEAQGLDKLARDTKAKSIAESKETAQVSYEQMKKSMPNAPKEFLDKFQAASDQYTISIYESWTVEESMRVWKDAYAVDLSEAELRKILEGLESESAKKELAAAKRATKAWQEFISERSRTASEKALLEYTTNIQRINESTPHP